MLDPSYAGHAYPPALPYLVGREKIREFALAVGAAHPAYLDPEAARALGYPDVIAPPTFATVITMRAGAQVTFDPALGLDYSRVVHGEQRFVHTRPIRAGDVLVTTVHIDNIRQAAGNDMLYTRAEVTTEAGEPVCTAYSTLVARGTAEEG